MATTTKTIRMETESTGAWDRGTPISRNVLFGVVDYLVQPILMLLTARYLVRTLGISLFGIWILVLAIIGSSGTICTGFGDAAIKYVAVMRGRMDHAGVAQAIHAALIVNASLGLALAFALALLAPWASRQAFHLNHELGPVFVSALRLGACVLVVRSLSFVFIGALRAFERYEEVTVIMLATRLATAISALSLVYAGYGVGAMLAAVLFCEVGAVLMLSKAGTSLWRQRSRLSALNDWRGMTSFGFFNWIQAISGTLFSQADRLMVAALLGPAALSYYGVCVQCAQPIHGLTAAGSNVLFPHLSARVESHGQDYIQRTVHRSLRITFICVSGLTLLLIAIGRPFLSFWMGASFAQHAAMPLILVTISFGFLALNIPGHYGLLALGQVRFVTAINVAGCVLSLLVAWMLIPKLGIAGAALGRLSYGPLTWLVYARIYRRANLN